MIKELWKLANIVTGFSVVQCLTFAIALGNGLLKLQSAGVRMKLGLVILCVVFSVAYSLAVLRCWKLAMSIESKHEAVWRQVTNAQNGCIWLFTTLPVFGLFAHNILGK